MVPFAPVSRTESLGMVYYPRANPLAPEVLLA